MLSQNSSELWPKSIQSIKPAINRALKGIRLNPTDYANAMAQMTSVPIGFVDIEWKGKIDQNNFYENQPAPFNKKKRLIFSLSFRRLCGHRCASQEYKYQYRNAWSNGKKPAGVVVQRIICPVACMKKNHGMIECHNIMTSPVRGHNNTFIR